MKRFLNEIQLINYLVNYLNSLKPFENQLQNKEVARLSESEIKGKLSSDSQWQKEKGVIILQPKKSRDEEEPDKKHKKHKKNKNK